MMSPDPRVLWLESYRACRHCSRPYREHAKTHCLFQSTQFSPISINPFYQATDAAGYPVTRVWNGFEHFYDSPPSES